VSAYFFSMAKQKKSYKIYTSNLKTQLNYFNKNMTIWKRKREVI
jgi:hypothetical protein